MREDKKKLLLLTSPTSEDADRILTDLYGFETIREKIAFLKGMFGPDVVGEHKNDETTYWSMLNAVIKS